MRSLALGSPRVCVRRDRKHVQGKVLKARARWFSNLHLPQARAGSTYCAILALASGSGLGHPATHLRSHQRCARCTRCWVAALCARGPRVESSSQTRILLALGSPRVCVRRDRKHAQGKVLKARACWFSNLHLPQARAGSTYCVLLALASGSGLGHPATHPRSLQCCASRTRCWVAASRERGLRVESSSKTCFRLLWALPECASGGTGNTRAGKGA